MNLLQVAQKKVAALFGRNRLPEKPKHQTFTLESQPVEFDPDKMRATKAYADQRQKAPRNRTRKPAKAMRNLYKLSQKR